MSLRYVRVGSGEPDQPLCSWDGTLVLEAQASTGEIELALRRLHYRDNDRSQFRYIARWVVSYPDGRRRVFVTSASVGYDSREVTE